MALSLYQQKSQNIHKTWLIMVLFTVFVTTIAYVFGKAAGGGNGISYAGIALIFSGFSSLGSYFFADKLVIMTTGAKPIKKSDFPTYYGIVETLAIASGMPMPKVYVLEDPALNAFATGRDPNHGVVCATTGILAKLSKTELEGVIAHELSHISNYDTRLMAVVSIMVGSIAIITDMFMRNLWWGGMSSNRDDDNRGSNGAFLIIGIVLAIISPLIATLIQLAVSRRREFLADASGALLTRYPEGLASALEKLKADDRPVMSATNGTAHLFIDNPFEGKSSGAWFANLFSTHPPLEERIKILRSM